MFKKKNHKKTSRAMLSAYSIIMILIVLLGILSHVLPKAKYQAAPAEVEEVELVEAVADETTALAGDATPLEAGDATTLEGNVVDSAETTGETAADETATYESLEACEEAVGGECVIVDGSGVEGAKLYQILIAPILGFVGNDKVDGAIDVCVFVMILGGFLAVMAKTKALETGIKILVKKLHGKEYLLILLLMFIFSILGTTYGFLEESVGFYVLIAATMYAAGMDPLVGVATILLGAGSGVLGSTINPFATGATISAMEASGVEFDTVGIYLIGVILWLTTLAISAFFVVRYAKKVQRDKGSTFLSLREQAAAEKKYSKFLQDKDDETKLTGKQIASLILFGFTFVVMIISFIPWGKFFEDNIFSQIHGWFGGFFEGGLTGAALGDWWFYEAALWFFLMSIVISLVNREGEHSYVDTFIDGADDMIGVVLVIVIARGASVLMSETSIDNYIVYNATNFLATLPEMLFVPLNYLLHVVLSVLVPSSSGLATLSTPITTPVAANLGYSTNVAAMTIVAANGLVNLITPTCGAIMGGLALAKVDYSTWFKWGIRVVACIAVVNIVVLCLFSL